MLVETDTWPYSFPASEEYLKSDQRGNVFGRLMVYDKSVFFVLISFECKTTRF